MHEMNDANRVTFGKLLRAAAIIMIAATVSACSSSGAQGSSDRSKNESGRSESQLETHLEAQSQMGLSTGSSQRGLELRVLTVDDAGDRVAAALSRFVADSGAMNQADQERWNSWGLRWIAVPADELDLVLDSLKLTQASQVRWMGEFPQWRPIIRTGRIHNNTVRIGASQTSGADPIFSSDLYGRPRLLARLWTAPELTSSDAMAQVHLDIAVQMTQEKQENRWDTPALLAAIDEGMIIDELKMSLLLDSSSAFVLVGEDPLVQWVNEDGTVSISQQADGSLGPGAPQARTLGQQMLSTPGTGYVAPGKRYVAPKKVLIVLVPKVAGTYRLLGASSPQQQGRTAP